MSNIAKKVLDFLIAFCAKVFVDSSEGKFARFADDAIARLQEHFAEHGLTLSTRKREIKKKEGRTTSHNRKERFYILTEKAGVECPLITKPVYTGKGDKKSLLCWVTIPDSEMVSSLAELVSYVRGFLADVEGKSKGEIETVCIANSARQFGEDVANNIRQKGAKALASAIEKSKVVCALIAPYLIMDESLFTSSAVPLLKAMPEIDGITGEELLAYVLQQRAEASDEGEGESEEES